MGCTYFVSRHRFVGLTVERESPLPDESIAMRAASLGRLSNERMQQTKPGSAKHGPVFAADPRCSTDLFRPCGFGELAGRQGRGTAGQRTAMLSYGYGSRPSRRWPFEDLAGRVRSVNGKRPVASRTSSPCNEPLEVTAQSEFAVQRR